MKYIKISIRQIFLPPLNSLSHLVTFWEFLLSYRGGSMKKALLLKWIKWATKSHQLFQVLNCLNEKIQIRDFSAMKNSKEKISIFNLHFVEGEGFMNIQCKQTVGCYYAWNFHKKLQKCKFEKITCFQYHLVQQKIS